VARLEALGAADGGALGAIGASSERVRAEAARAEVLVTALLPPAKRRAEDGASVRLAIGRRRQTLLRESASGPGVFAFDGTASDRGRHSSRLTSDTERAVRRSPASPQNPIGGRRAAAGRRAAGVGKCPRSRTSKDPQSIIKAAGRPAQAAASAPPIGPWRGAGWSKDRPLRHALGERTKKSAGRLAPRHGSCRTSDSAPRRPEISRGYFRRRTRGPSPAKKTCHPSKPALTERLPAASSGRCFVTQRPRAARAVFARVTAHLQQAEFFLPQPRSFGFAVFQGTLTPRSTRTTADDRREPPVPAGTISTHPGPPTTFRDVLRDRLDVRSKDRGSGLQRRRFSSPPGCSG